MQRNAWLGMGLFAIYVVLYGGFVLLNAFWPTMMEATPFAGLNLAVIYGFGLIVAAFGLALLYGVLCTAHGDAEQSNRPGVQRRDPERTS